MSLSAVPGLTLAGVIPLQMHRCPGGAPFQAGGPQLKDSIAQASSSAAVGRSGRACVAAMG
eukprot:1137042-Lingulodinium_polyedra.AAC.1